MGDVTKHFDYREFTCKCGCSLNRTDKEFIKKLEKLYEYFENTVDGISAIIINSGYRCAKSSSSIPGAFIGDTHNLGFGADLHIVKGDGASLWSSLNIAAVAEKLGFNGIGIITNTDIHLDDRTIDKYSNDHWFGNEANGQNNIISFAAYLPALKINNTHKITVIIDGKTVYEREV